LEASCLDSYDVARRGFLEACYLLYEFRLKESGKKATEWLEGKNDAWKPRFKRWEEVVLTAGPPAFGPEHGDSSELEHPTFQASQNSGAVLSHLLGLNGAEEEFRKHADAVRADIAGTLFRVTWISLSAAKEFIDVPLDQSKLQRTVEFFG